MSDKGYVDKAKGEAQDSIGKMKDEWSKDKSNDEQSDQ